MKIMLLNETFKEIINEEDNYPSLEEFRDSIGTPTAYIDTILGIMQNMEKMFSKELREDLYKFSKITENASKFEKNDADKKEAKRILYKYKKEAYQYKKAKLDGLARDLSRAIQSMASLENAFNLANKLYSEIK